MYFYATINKNRGCVFRRKPTEQRTECIVRIELRILTGYYGLVFIGRSRTQSVCVCLCVSVCLCDCIRAQRGKVGFEIMCSLLRENLEIANISYWATKRLRSKTQASIAFVYKPLVVEFKLLKLWDNYTFEYHSISKTFYINKIEFQNSGACDFSSLSLFDSTNSYTYTQMQSNIHHTYHCYLQDDEN